MRKGLDVELREFEELWNTPAVTPEVPESSPEQHGNNTQDLAARLMSEKQLSMQAAKVIARQVRAALPTEKDPDKLYLYALDLYQHSESAETEDPADAR